MTDANPDRRSCPGGHPLPLPTAAALIKSQRIIRLARRAGVKLTMHALRKGFGCYYAGKVPAQVLQKLVRHGDIKTTMAYDANVDQAAEDAVRDRQRNSSRYTTPSPAPAGTDVPEPASDATPDVPSE